MRIVVNKMVGLNPKFFSSLNSMPHKFYVLANKILDKLLRKYQYLLANS